MLPSIAQLNSAIETEDFIGVRSAIITTLTRIALEPNECEAVWHPLGFMYIRLVDDEQKTLRLHIWSKEAPKIDLATSQLHNHNWDLTSYVLCGEILNHNLELVNEPTIPTHRIYEVIYINHINVLYPTDSLVSYNISSTSNFLTGDKYFIKAGDFHYTELGKSDVAATIVLTKKVAIKPPLSLGPIQAATHQMERARASAGEVGEVVRIVLSCMSVPNNDISRLRSRR